VRVGWDRNGAQGGEDGAGMELREGRMGQGAEGGDDGAGMELREAGLGKDASRETRGRFERK